MGAGSVIESRGCVAPTRSYVFDGQIRFCRKDRSLSTRQSGNRFVFSKDNNQCLAAPMTRAARF
jgi:hypothetical protein